MSLNSEACSVIIVGYHGERWLPDCLATLRAASRERLRVIVVDNGCNGTAIPTACPDFDYQVIRTGRSLGFAEANNFALRNVDLSDGLVCFLNQDTKSEAGWLDACRRAFASTPDLGAVVPLTRTYDDQDWDGAFWTCARENPELTVARDRGQELAAWYEVPRVPAAALVVRSSALVAAGPFDPVFGSYFEDYDLCMRIRAGGYRVGIVTGGCVLHFGSSASATPAARRRRQRLLIRNRAIHRIRQAGPRRVAAVVRCFVGSLPLNLCRGLARPAAANSPAAWLAAHFQLLPLMGRLLWEARDRQIWRDYLDQIGWPAREA